MDLPGPGRKVYWKLKTENALGNFLYNVYWIFQYTFVPEDHWVVLVFLEVNKDLCIKI